MIPSSSPSDGLALSFTIRYQHYEVEAANVFLSFIFDLIIEQLTDNGFRAFDAELVIIPSTAATIKVDKKVASAGIRAFKPTFLTVIGAYDLLIEIEKPGERFNLPSNAPILELLQKARTKLQRSADRSRFKTLHISSDAGSGGKTELLQFAFTASTPTGVAGFSNTNVGWVVNSLTALVVGAEPSQITFTVVRCKHGQVCSMLGRGMMWKGPATAEEVGLMGNGTTLEAGGVFNGSESVNGGLGEGGQATSLEEIDDGSGVSPATSSPAATIAVS